MTQLGNELLHMQNACSRLSASSPPPPPPPPPVLPDGARRAELRPRTDRRHPAGGAAGDCAAAAGIRAAERRVAASGWRRRRGVRLDQAVEMAVPNYREIDRDPRWHRWLLGVDVLSGRVRQQLLNEAISSAAAPRVISFFRGFQQRGSSHRPQRASAVFPPGSGSPGSGDTPGFACGPWQGSAGNRRRCLVAPRRPIYTRAQIATAVRAASERCVCRP